MSEDDVLPPKPLHIKPILHTKHVSKTLKRSYIRLQGIHKDPNFGKYYSACNEELHLLKRTDYIRTLIDYEDLSFNVAPPSFNKGPY